ncbi:MAG: amino acid ABC transporter permease [Spirochaetota bacterium]
MKRRIRFTWLDLLLLPLILGVAAWMIYRVSVDLRYDWKWSVLLDYIVRYDLDSESYVQGLLLQGLVITLKLSIWSALLGSFLGLIMGLMKTSQQYFLRMLATSYVSLVRNIPSLVFIFIFYFFFSSQIISFFNLDFHIAGVSGRWEFFLRLFFCPPEQFTVFVSAILTLAIYEGAYMTEIVRGGIESIEKGQWEASDALGLSKFQGMRYIIFPQAFKRILPPMAGQLISVIKDSAIVSVISVQDLTFSGMELMASTYRIFEIWITITAMYFILTFACSYAVRKLELYMERRGFV